MSATFDDIYNFEGAILKPLAVFIAEQNIHVYTPSNDAIRTPEWVAANPTLAEYLISTSDIQKFRPALHLMYQHGAETGHHNPTNYRPDAWTGTLTLAIVTPPEAASHEQHRARARNVMTLARTRLYADRTEDDDALLPYHGILDMVESGTSPATSEEDGHLISTISYQTKINVRPDAWPAEE